ncbi:MAG: TetR family transcriptional regulator [Bifidobacteriaceae bacterium]|jgi:DNA-binding transcriptional regulator YbjK|nr:TetR family transcriptional regulator [Bifidobacteriaceae bacterium]
MSTAAKPAAPGRRPDGEAKRLQILDAAVKVFGAGGSAALTHRSVAAAAGVPLGSTTYYFKGRDDLVRQTVHHAMTVEGERLRGIVDAFTGPLTVETSTTVLTEMFLDKTEADPDYDLALFELFMEATRNQNAREETRAWTVLLADLIDRVLVPTRPEVPRPVAVQIVAAAVDGLMLEAVANRQLTLADLREHLLTVIKALAA